jgi:hypothetical protein
MALQKITIDNFLGGIAPSRYYGATNQFQGSSRGVDLWRTTSAGAGTSRIGNATAGWTSAAVTNVADVTTTITKFVPSDTTSDTLMLYGYSPTKMYRIDTSNDTVTSNASWPQAITNGANGGMEFYRGSMYYANNSTQVGTFTPGSAPTFTANAITGLASSTRYRPMYVLRDRLYIGNGNQVFRRFVATDTANALILETSYEIDHFGKYGNYLVISASKNNVATGITFGAGSKIWLWDTVGSAGSAGALPNFELDFPESRCRGIKEVGGKLFALGINYLYELKGGASQLGAFVPVLNLFSSGSGLTVSNNNSPTENLDVWNGFLMFCGDNEVITYGSLDPSISPVFQAPWTLTNAGITSGARSDKVYASATSGNRLVVFSGGNATPQLDTTYLNFGGKVRVKGVRFHTAPFATGQTLTVSMLFDSGSGQTSVDFGTRTGSSTNYSELFFTPLTQPAVNIAFFRFDMSAGGPVIKPPIDIFYEPIDEPFTDVS